VRGSFSCAKQEAALISRIGAKELDRAVEIMGNPIPLPSYVPQGYQIQRVLIPEKGDYYMEGYGYYKPFRHGFVVEIENI
jgi:hypothetical protein